MTTAPWRRATAALWRRTSTAVVVLPSTSSEPIRLDGAAALFWDLLEEPTTLEEATDLLAHACGVDASLVRTDLNDVIGMLDMAGAIDVGAVPC